jgi:hypothetical protein
VFQGAKEKGDKSQILLDYYCLLIQRLLLCEERERGTNFLMVLLNAERGGD